MAGDGTAAEGVTTSTLAPPTTTATTLPPGRRMGVVLLAPDEDNNSLNFREGPGTDNPTVTELLPVQSGLVSTGAVEVVDGRVWHELITEEFRGWAYGYYLTEIWSPEEVEEEWEWEAALSNFANALVLGDGLADTVSWRGLFAIYYDQNLRRWAPDELSGLGVDETELKWSNTGGLGGGSSCDRRHVERGHCGSLLGGLSRRGCRDRGGRSDAGRQRGSARIGHLVGLRQLPMGGHPRSRRQRGLPGTRLVHMAGVPRDGRGRPPSSGPPTPVLLSLSRQVGQPPQP